LNGNGAMEFFTYVILMALAEFLQNFHNGNGRMATEWWKPGIIINGDGGYALLSY